MTEQTLMCRRDGCSKPVEISDPGPMRRFILQLQQLYRASTLAGDNAAQYGADIAVNSRALGLHWHTSPAPSRCYGHPK